MDDRTMYMFMEIIALINLLRGKIVPSSPPSHPPPPKKKNNTSVPSLEITSFTLNIQTPRMFGHGLTLFFSEKTPI